MKTITEITTKQPAAAILRLAPYCRVSSDSEDQRHSFAAQVMPQIREQIAMVHLPPSKTLKYLFHVRKT